MTKIIGIDLGTSNSAAAFLEAGRPKIIPSAEGASMYGKAFPSVVSFSKDGQVLVGEPARRQAATNPERTITAAKRKMGTSFEYKINGKKYTPQQISAFILQKINNVKILNPDDQRNDEYINIVRENQHITETSASDHADKCNQLYRIKW